jgi:FlaA1/EpsC-like NDP-sugar epimerase
MVAPMNRILLSMLHDGLMAALASVLALWLRVGEQIGNYDSTAIAEDAALFTLITLVFLRLSGLYRGIWRYASLNDLFAIGRAARFDPGLHAGPVPRDPPAGPAALDPRHQLVRADRPVVRARASPIACSRTAGSTGVFERDAHRRVPVLLVGAGDGAELFVARCAATGAQLRGGRHCRAERQPRRPLDSPRAGAGHHRSKLTEAVEKLTLRPTGGRSA